MASHDNYDKDVLKALQRIANSLEKIERKLPNIPTFMAGCDLSDSNIQPITDDRRKELGVFSTRPNCFTCKYIDNNIGEGPCRDCDCHSNFVRKE